jgi:hypothetical protein
MEKQRNGSREENEPNGGDGGVICSNFSDGIIDGN